MYLGLRALLLLGSVATTFLLLWPQESCVVQTDHAERFTRESTQCVQNDGVVASWVGVEVPNGLEKLITIVVAVAVVVPQVISGTRNRARTSREPHTSLQDPAK